MASVDNILNELAAFLSEIVWRIRVNLGMQSADSKPTPIEFGFDDKKISTPEIAGKYQVPKIYLPSNFKALVSASTVNLVKMRGVMAKIAQEMGDGMVVRYNKLGRRNYAPVCVFTPKTSDVPGWLGHVCGYGHYVRMLAMKELAWKRAENPWDWHRGTNIPEENKVWMKVRCEPPPPGYYLASGMADCWTHYLRYKLKDAIWYDNPVGEVSPAAVVDEWRKMTHKPGRWSGDWTWTKHPNWHLATERKRVSIVDGQEIRHDRKLSMPAWFGNSFETETNRAFALRVWRYYEAGYFLVWSGTMYALQADAKIPDWWLDHAWFWGCPVPTDEARQAKRNWSRGCQHLDDKEPIKPQSIHGDAYGKLPQEDVDLILQLIVRHTPPPGSVEEILPSDNRRLIDWPAIDATGGFRPTFTMPQNWENYIKQRRQDYQSRSPMAYVAKGVQLLNKVVSAIGGDASIGEVIFSLVEGAIETFADDLKRVMGDSWFRVLSMSTSLAGACVKEFRDAGSMSEVVSNIPQMLEEIPFDNFQNMLDYFGDRYIERGIEKNILQEVIEGKINDLSSRYHWNYSDDCFGSFNEYFTDIMDNSDELFQDIDGQKAFDQVRYALQAIE